MKNIIFFNIAVIAVATMALSCNQSSTKNSKQQANDVGAKQNATALTSSNNTVQAKTTNTEVKTQFVVLIVNDYLDLKNTLVADNDKAAAQAGNRLLKTLEAVDIKAISGNKQKEYLEIAENAKENAEHIGNNAGKIDHQREHLASLSKDISDLIELFGTDQKLYQDYCPMYNDSKGAIWISEDKGIKNPYYGSKMLNCGSVKKEF